MRRWFISIFTLLIISLLISVAPVQADESGNYYIPSGQVVEGPVLLGGNQVRVDGMIDGDLYAAGNDIVISGEVTGDIIAAGQHISISGPVSGDLRLAGQTVLLQGNTSGSAAVLSQNLALNKQASIMRDLLVFAASTRLEGDLQRNLKGGMENLYISGTIGKDIDLYETGNIELDGATIGGDLSYSSTQRAEIKPDTVIGGEESWTKTEPVTEAADTATPWSSIPGFLISLAGLLIVWGAVKLWRSSVWEHLAQPAINHPGSSLGIGLLLLLATPLLAIILFITVIGIPAGILILILYGVILYLSIIISGQGLVKLIKNRIQFKGSEFWLFLAAVIVLMLMVKIPYIGWIIGIAILSTGLGSVFKALTPQEKTDDNPEAIV